MITYKKPVPGGTAELAVVVLAAGKGTRMENQEMAKVMHEIDLSTLVMAIPANGRYKISWLHWKMLNQQSHLVPAWQRSLLLLWP